jgi:hypothetical protein
VVDVAEELLATDLAGPRSERDEVRTRRQASLVTGAGGQMGPDLAAQTVADHCGSHLPWYGERDSRRFRVRRGGSGQVGHRHAAVTSAAPSTTEVDEGAAITDPPDQADRR